MSKSSQLYILEAITSLSTSFSTVAVVGCGFGHKTVVIAQVCLVLILVKVKPLNLQERDNESIMGQDLLEVI
jgi:hypothetical protein